ncbi:hypothetical protein HY932_01170 [Candidatus Falkowbacteria bacterium]|nr:hypothetical protein [Candidatus Falkowbacteria bacterium]
MSLENVAAAARKKTEEALKPKPENIAAEALEELEEKVESGEWDPEEFGATEEVEQKTINERPGRV